MNSSRPINLVVSVDTEEDNWLPSREAITARNIAQLPRLDRLFERSGVRATYFSTYQVAADPAAGAVLRELAAGGRAEIGAHLHPWNTPPSCAEDRVPVTMLKNFPEKCQAAKLRALTARLEETLGTRPTTFRAGRFGLAESTVRVLLQAGYRVDSSVTPFRTWERFDDGPSFVGAPTTMYRLSGREDVRIPNPDGGLIEVPITVGYNRVPAPAWGTVAKVFSNPVARRLRLAGLASQLGITRLTTLSPETSSVRQMLSISRMLIEAGASHLHLFFHSSSLEAGLNPFVTSRADVDRFYGALDAYLDRLSGLADLSFRTVGEMALEAAESSRVPGSAPRHAADGAGRSDPRLPSLRWH
jgi:hypothetical protein